MKGKKIPLPGRLPPITRHAKPVDSQIAADDSDFGFKSSTIAPHSTAAGWLYYDIRDLDRPPLKGATHRSPQGPLGLDQQIPGHLRDPAPARPGSEQRAPSR